jgi:hypothetical protein
MSMSMSIQTSEVCKDQTRVSESVGRYLVFGFDLHKSSIVPQRPLGP